MLTTWQSWPKTKFFFFPGSADEDSGVGGSPGCNASRPMASNCHSCNVCNKKFSRADILRKHVKTHVNSSCSVCGQIFNDKVALAKHQSEVGPSFDNSRFQISDHGLIINLILGAGHSQSLIVCYPLREKGVLYRKKGQKGGLSRVSY